MAHKSRTNARGPTSRSWVQGMAQSRLQKKSLSIGLGCDWAAVPRMDFPTKSTVRVARSPAVGGKGQKLPPGWLVGWLRANVTSAACCLVLPACCLLHPRLALALGLGRGLGRRLGRGLALALALA
eukprot:scaffold874_cov233-Pinguiococcus_pyrenoidosus.AAC.4